MLNFLLTKKYLLVIYISNILSLAVNTKYRSNYSSKGKDKAVNIES